MSGAPPNVDISKATPVAYEMEKPLKSKLVLADGTTLEIEIPLGSIFRSPGYNAQDGMPIYSVQTAPPIVRFLVVPEELRKRGVPIFGGR